MSGSVALDVDAALSRAREGGLDRFDAQALLAEVLGRPRSWLLAHGEVALNDDEAARFATALARRAAGEPLAYLRGRQEFYGLDLAVGPAVLVPRADTETLVTWALELLAGHNDPEVLDLGTGSGAVALAIARHAPGARVTAVDASAEALAIAQANGTALGLDVSWHHSDWFDALETAARFDLIVSNPPYIAQGDPHLAALAHEPAMALTSGPEGLDAIGHIVVAAPDHLHEGGWLLLEHGHEQNDAVAARLREAGFENVALRRDLAARPRCTGGQLVRLRRSGGRRR